MKILVFGGTGQVGHELGRAPRPVSFELIAPNRGEADITKPAAVARTIARYAPELIINLAAYTAVDRAESEPEAAWAANCAGAANIAAICGDNRVPLIHLSTDYVFDGSKSSPYLEEDPVNPLNVYGCSKEASERAVRAGAPRHIVLRTSWVYSAHGANFVKTMLRLGVQQPVLRVVADQHGCPTAAADIAGALIALAERIGGGADLWGTFHFASASSTSWHSFAEEIFDLAARLGGWARPRVEPITTDQYPTPARRPLNSVLNCRRIAGLGISPPPWRSSLAGVVGELVR